MKKFSVVLTSIVMVLMVIVLSACQGHFGVLFFRPASDSQIVSYTEKVKEVLDGIKNYKISYSLKSTEIDMNSLEKEVSISFDVTSIGTGKNCRSYAKVEYSSGSKYVKDEEFTIVQWIDYTENTVYMFYKSKELGTSEVQTDKFSTSIDDIENYDYEYSAEGIYNDTIQDILYLLKIITTDKYKSDLTVYLSGKNCKVVYDTIEGEKKEDYLYYDINKVEYKRIMNKIDGNNLQIHLSITASSGTITMPSKSEYPPL